MTIVWDGRFNAILCGEDAVTDLLECTVEHRLLLVDYHRPDGSKKVSFTLRGTVPQFAGWIRDYYDLSDDAEQSRDADVFAKYLSHFAHVA